MFEKNKGCHHLKRQEERVEARLAQQTKSWRNGFGQPSLLEPGPCIAASAPLQDESGYRKTCVTLLKERQRCQDCRRKVRRSRTRNSAFISCSASRLSVFKGAPLDISETCSRRLLRNPSTADASRYSAFSFLLVFSPYKQILRQLYILELTSQRQRYKIAKASDLHFLDCHRLPPRPGDAHLPCT